jgi:hypothetical protein
MTASEFLGSLMSGSCRSNSKGEDQNLVINKNFGDFKELFEPIYTRGHNSKSMFHENSRD